MAEEHALADHVAVLLPDAGPPAPWDGSGRYRAANVQLYFEHAPEPDDVRLVRVDSGCRVRL